VPYSRLLRNREFAALLAAQVVSGLGDQIARVAVALAVLERSDSALYAAAAFAVSYVPSIFGGTILGPLADRVPRRSLLLGCDAFRAVFICILAIVGPSEAPLWVAFALLFIAESVTPVYDAAWASTLPDVLTDPDEYMRGSGLLRVLYLLQQVVGLAAGGAAVALVSVRWALFLDASTFILSALAIVAWVRPRPAGVAGGGGIRTLLPDVREGVRDLFGDPARRALVLVAWSTVVYMITPMSVGLPYAQQVGESAASGSLLMAATLAGTAAGSAWVVRHVPQRQLELVLPMAAVSSSVLLLALLTPPLWLALVLWFVSGAFTGFLVPLIGSVALFTDGARRGRVMALAAAGYNLLVALVYLGGGLVADIWSPAVAVAAAGAVGLVMTAVARVLWPTAALRRAVKQAYVRGAAESGLVPPPAPPAPPATPSAS
jgi:MFS family permease